MIILSHMKLLLQKLVSFLTRPLSLLVCGILLFSPITTLAQDDREPVRVALLVTGDAQMKSYSNMFENFEQQFGYPIDLKFYSDITFKTHIDKWINSGEYDLLYWQAGKRLENLIDRDGIIALNKLIEPQLLRQYFRQNALEAVTYNEQIYAVPIAQYIWGFYYNQKVFDELKIEPPKDWASFQAAAETCRQAGIAPLFQATQDGWPVLAWLDYIALDIGGHEFRESLLADEPVDPELLQELKARLNYVLANEMFFVPSYTWRWEQAVPALVRKQACMTLSAQFTEGKIEELNADFIQFFPFPYNNPAHAHYEVAPMDLLVVPVTSNRLKAVTEFLSFYSGYSRQSSLANELGWLSVSRNPRPNPTMSGRMSRASERIQEAKHLVQYFDRDSTQAIADRWAKAMVKSLNENSITAIEPLLKADTKSKLANSSQTSQ